MTFTEWWSKYGNMITGLSIILFVCFAWYMVVQDHKLKLEINENCGWGEEDYRCYCEQNKAMEIYNKLNNKLNLSLLDNVSLAG